jgi:hypothetical protein
MDNPKEERERILEITRLHTLDNSIWKMFWTSHNTDYRMNELAKHMTNNTNSECTNFLVVS